MWGLLTGKYHQVLLSLLHYYSSKQWCLLHHFPWCVQEDKCQLCTIAVCCYARTLQREWHGLYFISQWLQSSLLCIFHHNCLPGLFISVYKVSLKWLLFSPIWIILLHCYPFRGKLSILNRRLKAISEAVSKAVKWHLKLSGDIGNQRIKEQKITVITGPSAWKHLFYFCLKLYHLFPCRICRMC